MPIYAFRTSSYAIQIYISGSQRLTARDGFTGVAAGYAEPVKTFAAANFTLDETNKALLNNWITQEEYDQTVIQRTGSSPLSTPNATE